jgi:hypothetical protein
MLDVRREDERVMSGKIVRPRFEASGNSSKPSRLME